MPTFISSRRHAPQTLVAVGLGLALLFSAPTHGAIFRTVDAQGNVTYTDQPPAAGAKRVKSEQISISTPNTFQDSTPYQGWDPETTEDDNNAASYSLSIVSPSNDQAIRDNSGNIVVRTRITPELAEGDKARLELNGTLTGDPVEGGSIYLTNLPRGTHRMRLIVESGKGRRIAESPESVFHLQRFSQLSPAAKAQRARQQSP